MKKIILLCVAVFVFTVSIVNVVWFQGKKEHKAHLALNNIVALAQYEGMMWIAFCPCAEESVFEITGTLPDGGYVKETRYSCFSGDIPDNGPHPSHCRVGSLFESKTYVCDTYWNAHTQSYEQINCRFEFSSSDQVYPHSSCSVHTYEDHWQYW